MKGATVGENGDDAESDAGVSYFVLKGAVVPPDELSHHLSEEDVHDKIIEKA